jgi:hypothetical protein
MKHKITNNDGVTQHQYNTLEHCRVQLAEQATTTRAPLTTTQSISLELICHKRASMTPPPPKKRLPKKPAADKHACSRYIEEKAKDDERDKRYEDYNNDDNDDNNGGKRRY